mgnify:CR=1 FL=1
MTTLYGIKNCDTVKKARKWLDENNINYSFHDFRSDGITETQVADWLQELSADNLINKRSTTWKQLSDTERDRAFGDQAAQLLCAHPTLIKRPLLDTGKQRYVGFKAEQYQQWLA